MTVEMSGNRAFTTLSYNGHWTHTFGDGKDEPLRQSYGIQWFVGPLLVHRSWADCLCIA